MDAEQITNIIANACREAASADPLSWCDIQFELRTAVGSLTERLDRLEDAIAKAKGD